MSFQVRNAVSSTADATGNAVNIEKTRDGRVTFEVQAADDRCLLASVTREQARSLALWILRDEA
jgi:hypothetical protein